MDRQVVNNTPAVADCAADPRSESFRTSSLIAACVALGIVFYAALAHGQSRAIVVPQNPTLAAADKEIGELEADPTLSESEKAGALGQFRQARKLLEQAEDDLGQSRQMRDSAQKAPQVVADIQQRLNAPTAAPDPRRYETRSLKTLAEELRLLRADRDQLQSSLSEARADVDELNSAPKTLRDNFSDAQRELDRVLAVLAPDQAVEGPSADRAQIFLLDARRRALAARAERLRTEILTQDARASVAGARRDLLTRDLREIQAKITVLEGVAGKKQTEAVQTTQQEVRRTEAQVRDEAPAVQLAASENTALANELAQVIAMKSQLSQRQADSEQHLQRLEDDYKGAQQRVTLAGLSSALGQILREQRRQLPNLRSVRSKVRERDEAMIKVGLAQLRIDEALQESAVPVAYYDSLVQRSRADGSPEIGADERQQLERQLAPLLADYRELLQGLSAAYLAQLKSLNDLAFSERRLVERASEYAAFLDETLLWLPSAAPVGLDTARDIFPALFWLTQANNLSELTDASKAAIVDKPFAMMLVLACLWLLLRMRRSLRKQLAESARLVRNTYTDRFSHTIMSLGATLLLAMPAAFLCAFVGWRLAVEGAGNPYVYAIASGLSAMAMPLFLLRLFRYIYDNNGLAVAHFRWRAELAARMRRYLNFLVLIVPAGVFVVRTMDAQTVADYQSSLGRCAFIVLVLSIAWVNHRIFHPKTGELRTYFDSVRDRWVGRLRYVWYAIVIGTPLSFVGLAGYGYYFTALRLNEHQVATIRLVIGCVLLFHLVLRALVVARRRLAIEQANAPKASVEISADGSPVNLDIPNIDIHTIDVQTRSLARILIGWGAAVGVYFIWADVLPALGVLDEVVLWNSTNTLDGVKSIQHITLWSLCIAMVSGVVFAVAARNLPGVLEIVLQRLPVDAGGRYAISTLSQYLIVALGFVFIVQSLGVGWGQVQWLVAALSVGLGFGLQEIFANFISGIIILFERPVRIGDTVTIGELTGTVSRIRIRATTITDWDNKEIIIPNKSFITDKLINWTLSDSITRAILRIGVAYGTDMRKAYDVIWEVAKNNKRVLSKPESQLFFLGFGDSSLDFELRVFVGGLPDKLKATHELHMALNEAFVAHNIVIPFPQRDVHLWTQSSSANEEQAKGSGEAGVAELSDKDIQQPPPGGPKGN